MSEAETPQTGFAADVIEEIQEHGLTDAQEKALRDLLEGRHPVFQNVGAEGGTHDFEFKVHTLNPGKLQREGATGLMTDVPLGFQLIGLIGKENDPNDQAYAYFMRQKPSKAEEGIRLLGQTVNGVFFEELMRKALEYANNVVAQKLREVEEGEKAEQAMAQAESLVTMLAESLVEAEKGVEPISIEEAKAQVEHQIVIRPAPGTTRRPTPPSDTFAPPLDESKGPTEMDPNDAAALDRELGRNSGD